MACNSETSTELEPSTVVRSDDRANIIFIITDDHGYADLGTQEVLVDVKTPNIDELAAGGVRMTHGYVTAPQCTPSRAAIVSGRYQQKFGVDDNAFTPFPLTQSTLAEKLSNAGYATGMVGKWHLEIDANSKIWYQDVYAPGTTAEYIPSLIPFSDRVKYYPEARGYDDTFFGYIKNYRANFDLSGNSFEFRNVVDERFRVDVTSDAAITFIDKHKSEPFFLHLSYFAPHVPLDATQEYLARFPGQMPERRRYALAMMAAVDDGVGRIMDRLRKYGIDDDTLVVFISDNGAPLAITKEDVAPVSKGGALWDGSLNDPWIGEKGMLTEGAIRVPFIVNWKNHVPSGLVYDKPIISLDMPATAAHLAGVDYSEMDGINFIPFLNDVTLTPDRALFWRFWEQAAIRKGKWKYLKVGNEKEYLFDLNSVDHENSNIFEDNPAIVEELRKELVDWAETLKRPGLSNRNPSGSESDWYSHYFSDY